MPSPSNADPAFVMSPAKLSCIVSAMAAAAPSAFRSSSSYPATLSIPSLSTRFKPLNAVLLNVAARAALRSSVPIPERAPLTSARISVMSRKLPFESATATSVSPILIRPFSIFCVIWVIIDPNAVPASEPFSPWFAIPSSRAVTVSMSCPAAFRLAAQFPYASPSCSAVVLLFAWAYASMSAMYALFSASMPKADR